MIKMLESIGFSRLDSEVYLYLAKTGSKNEQDLVDALKISKRHLKPLLKSLENRGFIISASKRSMLFSAVDLEQLLAQYVAANIDQAQLISKNKSKFLSLWREMTNNNFG